mgnify:CR=1 FL=1
MNSIVQHGYQRVGVFVDVQNLYYSARHHYNKKVNFKALLEEAVQGRRLIRAITYSIKADVKEESNFHDMLTGIGFEVRLKDLQIFSDGSKKGDWDVGMAMDAIRMSKKLDTIVLVSGDGDFVDLIEYLRAQGCRVEVIAIAKSASAALREHADMFTDLGEKPRKFLTSLKPRRTKKKS